MQLLIQFFKELGLGRVIITGIFILFLLILGGIYIYSNKAGQMVILYSDLDLDDSNKIIGILESRNIKYELAAGGSIIKVPENHVLKLRMSMAGEGVPAKGSIVGYEIFDQKESFSTSSFLQNVNLLRALEGELARTITSLDIIDKARVHLVVPKRELFARQQPEPRASIILKVRGNKTLNKQEIDSIAHIVITAIPDLTIKNISIVDNKGRALKLGSNDPSDPGFLASQNHEYKVAYENRLKYIIEDLLEHSVGVGKVKAYVSADLNFDRIVTNSELYDPEGSVIRSIQSIQEKENNSSSEDNTDISVANNLPDATGENSGRNLSTNERSDETTNYEISKTVKNFIGETGSLKRLSIAVMVDGTYRSNLETKKIEYVPRSQEDLEKYTNLVKTAIGFREDRNDTIEVTSMPFADVVDVSSEETNEWLQRELPNIVQTIVIAVVIILLMILVVRPIAIKAFDVDKSTFAEATGTTKDHLSFISDADIEEDSEDDAIKSLKDAINDSDSPEKAFGSGAMHKKINVIVEKHPQETIMLIRRWLNDTD